MHKKDFKASSLPGVKNRLLTEIRNCFNTKPDQQQKKALNTYPVCEVLHKILLMALQGNGPVRKTRRLCDHYKYYNKSSLKLEHLQLDWSLPIM